MANCRGCGAAINFVELSSGKYMPVDPGYVAYEDAEQGDKLVLDDGTIMIVDHDLESEDNLDTMVTGRISHFSTCPKATDYRKK